ncbi:hypothetical protein HPP92_006954 [Vanilla planifolia]|uniref:Uncharacterized protein n=1 Tax=Vanilla planifolia TaxID=51239 RepID=A0A835VBE7_VANPL|nr:hypothetical protein HPP92_006954 [Vanilla planifolia]
MSCQCAFLWVATLGVENENWFKEGVKDRTGLSPHSPFPFKPTFDSARSLEAVCGIPPTKESSQSDPPKIKVKGGSRLFGACGCCFEVLLLRPTLAPGFD